MEIDKIVSILNSRGIRRVCFDDETLTDINDIVRASEDKPIQMVGYWGVGEKKTPNENDIRALERLVEIMRLTDDKIKVHLILADKHGELNGYKNNTYLKEISILSEEKNISTTFLSSIYEKLGFNVSDLNNVSDDIWIQFPDCYRCFLEKRASKHQKNHLAADDAKRYLHMTQLEKQKLNLVFPNCIWFTYGDVKKLRALYPKPVISIWPHKRGKSELPWFS